MSDESEQAAEPAKQPPEAAKAENRSQNQDIPKTIPPPNLPPEPCQSDKARTANEQKQISTWEYFERFVKIVECVAFVGGVATAIFIGIQWQLMRKASGDAEKTIELNTKQLGVMQGQLQEMQVDRNLDERAWVSPGEIVRASDNSYSSSFYFVLHFKNIGRTPSLHTFAWLESVTNYASVTILNPVSTTNLNTQLLFPNAEDRIDNSDRPMPMSIFTDALNGKIPIFVYGILQYEDIFGKLHWVRFSYTVDMLKGLAIPTQTGNECDTNN